MNALKNFFDPDGESVTAELSAEDFRKAFEAMMEGAAMLLDVVGELQYTYITKSGNKIRGRLDSPDE